MTSETETKTSSKKTTSEDPSQNRALECARAAIDKRAENLKILDLTELSGFTDYFVLCNGSSDRQVKSISDAIDHAMTQAGAELVSIEGYSEGRWVLMDYGDVVIHIFLDALREYYALERLWADAPTVKIPADFYGPGASRLN
ncbi:MAG: ribosome silencing factor [Bdellovibrionales bacterium]|nr:ribosome silencing factor [Bdellovibrionales bacterium]